MTGFPRDLLDLLRCPRDGGRLGFVSESRGDGAAVADALMKCALCGTTYPLEGGIARLMAGPLNAEDEHEISVRDREFSPDAVSIEAAASASAGSQLRDLMEIAPLVRALDPSGHRVLEIGSGSGRLTVVIAKTAARVLAVDFSMNALRSLAWRLRQADGDGPTHAAGSGPLCGRVGLVQADATRLRLAPRSFDRALSTTSLDNREQRMALYGAIAEALDDAGRYVGSVEHDDLGRRLLGLPLARRYANGIFLEHFSAEHLSREMAPFFGALSVERIRPRVPFMNRMSPAIALAASRTILALPVLRQLAELLMIVAERPVRPPVEGAHRSGSKLAQATLRWYSRRIGVPPRWEENEPI